MNYFFLGGPMAGIPCYNLPRFREVAWKLKANGYTIVSQDEFFDSDKEFRMMCSYNGRAALIELDDAKDKAILACASACCVGGVFLEGWADDAIAIAALGALKDAHKEAFEYSEANDSPVLQMLPSDFMISYAPCV